MFLPDEILTAEGFGFEAAWERTGRLQRQALIGVIGQWAKSHPARQNLFQVQLNEDGDDIYFTLSSGGQDEKTEISKLLDALGDITNSADLGFVDDLVSTLNGDKWRSKAIDAALATIKPGRGGFERTAEGVWLPAVIDPLDATAIEDVKNAAGQVEFLHCQAVALRVRAWVQAHTLPETVSLNRNSQGRYRLAVGKPTPETTALVRLINQANTLRSLTAFFVQELCVECNKTSWWADQIDSSLDKVMDKVFGLDTPQWLAKVDAASQGQSLDATTTAPAGRAPRVRL